MKYSYGFLVLVLCLITPRLIVWRISTGRVVFGALIGFVLYQWVRLGWTYLIAGAENPYNLQMHYYLQGALRWTFSLGCFFLGYQLFCQRSLAGRLYAGLTLGGFLLAASAIPPLMRDPGTTPVYQWSLNQVVRSTFFPSWVYFHPWMERYVIEQFAHLNYVGDLMAAGFFSALGLAVYHFELFYDEWREEKSRRSSHIPVGMLQPFFLFLTAALVITSAVLLLLSRGTILCFVLAFFFFLLGILLKFRSKTYLRFALVMVFVVGGFNLWAGNLSKAWQELQTLSGENTDEKRTSFSTNKEGARRALGMHKDYSVWGVGTGGYKLLAQRYAVEKAPPGQFDFSDHESMNHPIQVLAEEGRGACLYYLFLFAFFIEMIFRLFKVKSRFQFTLASAMLSWILMVLAHSSFNHLMERVSMSVLVYIGMGVALGLVRDDFSRMTGAAS